MRLRFGFCCVLSWVLCSCGGSGEAEENNAHVHVSAGDENVRAPEEDGMQIEGLMGTLSQGQIQNALQPRMDRFAGCFANRYDELEVLSGDLTFSFRIGTDGRVLWVFPSASTIGDRETERCLLYQAGRARFSEPSGGEAEFTWSIGYDPLEDVRPATVWDESRVQKAVRENMPTVAHACGGAELTLTAYVAPGGTVMAAGAATTDQGTSEILDCIVEFVQSWMLPDPGSYPAKVTFEIP